MAFEFNIDVKATIELVCSKDSSLDMEKEDYAAYMKSGGDKSLLSYKEGHDYESTTRFVFRRVLSLKNAKNIMNEQIGAEFADGKVNPIIRTGYIFEEFRVALINIINPEGAEKPLIYKKGSDNNSSEELVSRIHGAGVLDELHNAWSHAVNSKSEVLEKKS